MSGVRNRIRISMTSKQARAAIISACFALAGCTPFVNVARMTEMDRETAREAISIHSENDLEDVEFRRMGLVDGHSCKHWLWEPGATVMDAQDKVLHEARKRGANAVVGLSCVRSTSGVNLVTNCWSHVVCSAEAILLPREHQRGDLTP